MTAWDFVKNFDGDNSVPSLGDFPIADSQTLKVGDVVVLASGKLTKAGDGTARVAGVMAQAITTGSSAGGPLARVYIVTPSQVWRGKSSAAATSVVLGARTLDLNASQQVNVADSTGGCILVLATGATTSDVDVQFTNCEFA